MNLQEFVRVYDDVLSPKDCEFIIDVFEQNASKHEIHDTDVYKFHQLNLNQNAELTSLANNFCRGLVPIYDDYFKKIGLREYVDIDAFEQVRIKRYLHGTGEQFKTHVDITDKESAVRSCIAILYLNENDGYTTFPTLKLKVDPKPGRVVVFPPFWMFPHNGLAPTKVDKYIMMSCLHYS
jgi:prolyl 4-hydroxylase